MPIGGRTCFINKIINCLKDIETINYLSRWQAKPILTFSCGYQLATTERFKFKYSMLFK